MANALKTKWLGMVTDWYHDVGYKNGNLNGCYRLNRHHVTGRKSKHNKIAIGHWFVIPVPFIYHDVSSNDIYNVTHHRHNFTGKFGLQSELFKEMIESMVSFGYELPFGQDVIDAIMDTRK